MSTTPSPSPAPPDSSEADGARAGLLAGAGAYLLWGVLPLYFLLLEPAGPLEIVSVRVVFALLFCLALLAVARGWRRLGRVLADRRTMLLMLLAAALIFVNWLVYVIAATTGHVVEASLGYFINPIVTVLLGVAVLRERLRATQWVAVAVAVAAVLVLAVGYGSVPWLSLALAGSFGLYGLVKKAVGPRVDAVSGLTVETLWLTPLALAIVAVIASSGRLTLWSEGPAHF
ncbi:EamA family transporter RarD [Mycetocola reblochoni]|uniref:Protein rarD n=1 Tax=Mycetocola reblochoni REB411 TaxID=1255698 RepID=A0A1R4IAD0_9MICO|nr:Protein rarD [Mycetocola reblochoni REB411]